MSSINASNLMKACFWVHASVQIQVSIDEETEGVTGWFVDCLLRLQTGVNLSTMKKRDPRASLEGPSCVSPFSRSSSVFPLLLCSSLPQMV